MLTRKHYIMLAEVMHGAKPHPWVEGSQGAVIWHKALCLMIDRLAADNPRFHRATFLRAAHGNEAAFASYREAFEKGLVFKIDPEFTEEQEEA